MDDLAIREAPQRRILQGQLSRLNAMDRRLDSPGQQGPAGRRPMALTVMWGPIGMQTPRRRGSVGFEGLAPLVSPGQYLTPNPTGNSPNPSGANPIVATPGPFWWCSTGVYSDLCWTYTYIPYSNTADYGGVASATILVGSITSSATSAEVGATTGFAASGVIVCGSEQIAYSSKDGTHFLELTRGYNGTTAAAHDDGASVVRLNPITAPVAGVAQAGLYDPAIAANGGGIILNNFAGTQQFDGAPVHPRLCAEVDIYDTTRGRSLTSGRVPIETFTGGAYGFKKLPKPMRFERGTQIEPRLYVTEARMMSVLDETNAYRAADVQIWISMVMKGYTVQARNQAGFPSYKSVGGP